jgi:hypothetical protein
MKLKTLTLIALLGTAIALPFAADAQPGKGARYGFNADNTRGWSLMTATERTEHQNKMLATKTVDECKAVQDEYRKLMDTRAKEKGVTLGTPKVNACDQMKAQGIIK